MASFYAKATVLGGGAFGTAMAEVLGRKGTSVVMWVREPEVVAAINDAHENSVFLRGCPLSANVSATTAFEAAVGGGTELILLVVPTPFLRRFVISHHHLLPRDVPLVCCSKGIENGTLLTPYEILVEELPGKFHPYLCALSGPSFAKEVAQGLPTSVTIASANEALARTVQEKISEPAFRCYRSTDVIGAELCGALKNVIAIASGASEGFGFGCDARAALITRGLAEITRLAVAKGAQRETMMGLAGVGDLVLTCTSTLSRNFTVGRRVAGGETLAEISLDGAVAEGVATSISVHEMAEKLGVEMPICEAVYAVLHGGKPIKDALAELQTRPLRAED